MLNIYSFLKIRYHCNYFSKRKTNTFCWKKRTWILFETISVSGISTFNVIFFYFATRYVQTFSIFWPFSYRACIVRFSASERVKLVLDRFILTKRDAPSSEFHSERKQQACSQAIIFRPDIKISQNTEIRVDAWSVFCKGKSLVSPLLF